MLIYMNVHAWFWAQWRDVCLTVTVAQISPFWSGERKIFEAEKGSFDGNYIPPWVSLAAQLVKNPPAMQETRVWFLGQEDPLEKG